MSGPLVQVPPAASSGGGMTLLGSTTLGAPAASISVSGLTANSGKKWHISVDGTISLAAAAILELQINGSSTGIVYQGQWSNGFGNLFEFHDSPVKINYTGAVTVDPFVLVMDCERPSTGRARKFQCKGHQRSVNLGVTYASTAEVTFNDTSTAITSIALVASAGTPLDTGLKMVVEEYDGGQ